METMPAVENAAAWFNAKTVTHRLDVVDNRTAEGSTVRIYNAAGFEFMTLKSNNVSTRFDSLFGEKPVGTRHAEDGRLYAILKDGDSTRGEPGGAVRRARDGDPALLRERSRLPALSMTRPGAPRRARGSAERKEKRA